MSDYEYMQLLWQRRQLDNTESVMDTAANRDGAKEEEWHNLQVEHQYEINNYLEYPDPGEPPGIHE